MPSSRRLLIASVLLSGVASLFFTSAAAQDYPRKPDRLGSGRVKWTESATPDGWTKVTNQGGATLGYSKDSGLQLIQVDGYAFKDLNRNNLLDKYEDWRLDPKTRAASMAQEFSVEQMMGMKMNPFGLGSVNQFSLDAAITNALDMGYRQLRAPGATASGTVKASWNNMVQKHVEGFKTMVCLPAVWIADPKSGDVSEWPSNLAMAATFDPAVGATLSGDLRVFGLPTLLQSLADSHVTGVMRLLDGRGRSLATMELERGRLAGARYGSLEGAEVVYQLLERPLRATFVFVPRSAEPAGVDATSAETDARAAEDLTPLLLEGLRRHDELRRAAVIVPDDARFETTDRPPRAVTGEEDIDLVISLWEKVVAGTTPQECERSLAADAYRVRRCLVDWVEDGALRLNPPDGRSA